MASEAVTTRKDASLPRPTLPLRRCAICGMDISKKRSDAITCGTRCRVRRTRAK